nr:hypothetical protein [uncultured Desulfobacter sp.]
MNDFIEEVGKGIVEVLAQIFINIFFNFFCYYVGWPFCKLLTLGRYPQKVKYDFMQRYNKGGFLCSCLGFIIIAVVVIYLTN